MHNLKPHWPLFIAAGLLLIIVAVQLTLSVKENDGQFVYALDDPYIHMAIARNFARYGVWGVTRYEFSSSTSSLLWTLLLAAAYRFTMSAYVPLILNLVSAVLLLVAGQRILKTENGPATLIILCGLVLLVPLSVLIFSGMEHTAHLALSVGLIYTAANFISARDPSRNTPGYWLLLLLTAVAPLIRYESLFLIFAAVLLLGLRRRYLIAVVLVAVALVPLSIYGLVSLGHGSEFLPNPLLLKGTSPRLGFIPFLQQVLEKLRSAPHLLALLFIAVWYLVASESDNRWQERRVLSVIFIIATVLHLLLAGIGWFYRYEAYLIAIGILLAGQITVRSLSALKERQGSWQSTLTVVLALIAVVFLVVRANRAMGDTIRAMNNTYDQQFQMARFLATNYRGESVAANDIGAINFMADIRCLDLRGLGSVDVMRAKLEHNFNTQKIAELLASHQVRIALLYSIWFEGDESLPQNWIKVGQWTTRECVVCGNPVVSFYAANSTEAEGLKRNLQAFSSQLPADVVQAGSDNESR